MGGEVFPPRAGCDELEDDLSTGDVVKLVITGTSRRS
jgi:hypothetical protein